MPSDFRLRRLWLVNGLSFCSLKHRAVFAQRPCFLWATLRQYLSTWGYYSRPMPGRLGTTMKADISLRSLWEPHQTFLRTVSLPCFTQPFLPPLSPSLRVGFVSQSDSNPSLAQLPPSSLTGIFSNTFLACLITCSHLFLEGLKLTQG